MMAVLQNLQGVYSVVLEGDQATVKIKGTVSPDFILRVLERSSKHGQVSNFRLDGQVGVRGNYYNGPNDYPPYEPPYPPYLRGPGPDYPYYPPGPEYQYYPQGLSLPPPPPLPYGLLPPPPPYPLPSPPRHNCVMALSSEGWGTFQ
ncbi:leucine-rich repeat extensin-like protein 5 [Tripterygium wilfordii]|uniref:leucine-rich repeat extensin-like protein 5 n=1 Tax=Tripterygium wilfordii TaxID=458696 RepID=UPI0018F8326A|nr:leucine-rich repeat extensin-like protein 5 [Tripterygium wilfordii]